MRYLVILLFVAAALAQTHKSHHEEGYRMTPMGPPPLRAGLGTTSLKMTTKSAKAQEYFQQGVKLLHCFWDFEAYRAFKESARLDPEAAMAWWGIVQSISDYEAMKDEKDAALKKAKDLAEKASQQERYYVRALDEEAHRGEMEALVDAYPDDVDARLFLAISLNSGYDDDGRPKKDTLYGISLLENILAKYPENAPANHYLIHFLEAGPHAGRAVNAAEALGRLAPGSGHMVHMPGHIFYELGDQERARGAFLASMRVDQEYMQREKVKSTDDWNFAHNLSYLIASDAEAGRYKEALEMAELLDRLPANPFLAVGRPAHAITIGSTTARLQLRFGNWQAVIDHPINVGDEKVAGEAAVAFREGVLAYARGMKAIEEKRFEEAGHESDRLDAIQWRLNSAMDDPDGDEHKPKRVFGLLDTASLDLRGHLKCARGDKEAGFELLRRAVEKEKSEVGYSEPPQYGRPEWESLGYAYLGAGKTDLAREAFQKELKQRPKSGHALYGIALSYGGGPRAVAAYREFLEAWKNADAELPMVRRARAALAAR